MSTGTKIGAAFVVVLVIVIAVGTSAYVSTQRLVEANRSVAHTHEVVEGLERVLSALMDAETGQRGFVLTGEDRYLEHYNAAAGQIDHDIDALADLTQDNPAQQASLKQVRRLAKSKMAELQETITLRRDSGLDAALKVVKTDRGKKIMDDLRGVITEMQTRERQLLDQRSAAADADASRTIWTTVIWMPLALLVFAISSLVLMRNVRLGGSAAPAAPAGGQWAMIAIRYLFAVVAVAVGLVVRWWLVSAVGDLPLFVTFYPAVLLVASVAGGGPGILATVLGALAADYWVIPPYGQFSIDRPNDVLALGIFTGANLFLCLLAERLRRARWAEAVTVAQQQQLDELARLNEELSQQAEELSQQTEELAHQNEELQSQSEEIQALNTELGQREDVLQKLLDAARLASTEEAVIREICAAALQMFGPAVSAVAVYENEAERLTLRAQAGVRPDETAIPSRPLEHSFAALVLAENKTAALADASLRPDVSLLRVPGEPPFQAVLASPLRADGRPFGVVAIYSRQKQLWTAVQFGLAEWLAAQCARILQTLRLQEQIRRSHALLQAIIDNTPALIYVKDLEGHITVANRSLGAAVGMDVQRILGKTSREFVADPKDAEIHSANDRRVIETGQAVTAEESASGRVFLSMKFPLRDAQGNIFATGGVSTDITDRKQAEEAMRRSAEDLARSNKDLEQFAYVASHDLQEPLRAVTGFVQLLQQQYGKQLDAKANDYIGYTVDGAHRMQTLIADLLTYSRVGSRGREPKPTDTSDVLRRALGNLAASIKESAAEITHGDLPTVRADETQLIQLFQNLLGNAIKFRGPEAPKIHVEARRNHDHWLFSVRDNGIGINPEFSDRIFMIFQRLHSRKKYPGTGIGLAICKKIVERHGGQIWVESQAGQGATFHFTIPT